MPVFDLTFMRVDRAESPTVVEGFSRRVNWPFLPRERESVEIGNPNYLPEAEMVSYDAEGYPTVYLGRLVLDDLEAAQLRKLGWRVKKLPLGSR